MNVPSMIRRKLALAGLMAAALALTLAACGGSTTTTTPAAGTTAAEESGPETIALADTTDPGKILVDGEGNTLYLFEADTSPTSTCTGDCAAAWPPVTTDGTPEASDGVDAKLLDTTTRDDGSTQVVYNGHPLYYFSGDTSPGDMNGQGSDAFGAEWYVVGATGDKLESGEESAAKKGKGGGTADAGADTSAAPVAPAPEPAPAPAPDKGSSGGQGY